MRSGPPSATTSCAGIQAHDARIDADAVVSAVPWSALPALLPEAWRDDPAFAAASRLTGSPIVSIEMWLDQVVVDRAMVGLRDCEVEWVFDKGRLYGREGPPQHLAFIISAAYRSTPRPNAELVGMAEAALRRYFPAMAGARVTRTLVLREADATFSCDPASEAIRPGAGDAHPRARPRRRLDGHRAARDHRGRGAQRARGRAAARGMSERPVFPVARWLGLAWLAVWIPAYWSFYGPVVFLNLCDIAVILTCVGLWRGSALLLSSQAVSSLVVDLAWVLDLAWRGDHRPPSHRRHRVHVGPRVPGRGCAPCPCSTSRCRSSSSGRCGAWATTGARPGCRSASPPWC